MTSEVCFIGPVDILRVVYSTDINQVIPDKCARGNDRDSDRHVTMIPDSYFLGNCLVVTLIAPCVIAFLAIRLVVRS